MFLHQTTHDVVNQPLRCRNRSNQTFSSGRRSRATPPVAMGRSNALPSRKIDPSQFSAEQLAFLERKRAYKAGETLNPLQAFVCPDCGGKGTVVCWECSGAGVNHRNIVQDVMRGSEEDIRQQNGVIDVSWFLMKGGPCFVCRGKPECPCRSCEGTGIKDFKIDDYCGD